MKFSVSLSLSSDEEQECTSRVPYANVVVVLMYAMVCMRPDVSHVAGEVRRYMHDPGKGHWQSVKWILRYFLKIIDVGLVFECDDTCNHYAIGYGDSDYASDLDKRRSTTGYVFTISRALVSWKSTLQSTGALSTSEVEYMALTEVVKEAIWLRGLLDELGVGLKQIPIYSDSQSDICLAKNLVFHVRTKHIDVFLSFCAGDY